MHLDLSNILAELRHANAGLVRYRKLPFFTYAPELIALQKQFNNMKGSEDEPGILKSQKVFHDLIDAEIASGIPANRIVIGGFSQGGAMSIFSGVTYPKQLGGIFALSSYLLLESKVFAELAPAGVPNKNTPIFMGHGDQDPLVLPDWGRRTEKALTEAGYKVELKWYK